GDYSKRYLAMVTAKNKGSGRNQIKKEFRKFSKQMEGSEKLKSPDRLNKRKPAFIKRNIYLKEKFKKTINKDHGIFCSCSSSSGSSTLCGKNCNCELLLSSCSPSCPCRCECTNKPFQQRHIKKMKIVQTEKCGYGIVADEDINSGEFIIEYVGEVIDNEICEQRLWKLKHKVETNFYLCQINNNLLVDATYKGNKSRYFNHSCDPNTVMQKWMIDGETRLGIFATRDINKGEHLTYDYHLAKIKIAIVVPLKELEAKTPRVSISSPVSVFDKFLNSEVTYEDGVTEIIDMSGEVWKLITV
ncbi:hypothetical protein F2Q69_00049544, partial [Brassica cretica]